MRLFLLLLIVLISLILIQCGIHEENSGWCLHGATTATTNECICSTHRGYFCTGQECQTGFGMSFFSKECSDCKCTMSEEWKERKKTLKQMVR